MNRPPPEVATEHCFELLESHSKSPLAICFAQGNDACFHATLATLAPSPSPAVSKSLFSVSVSPSLPCRQEHQHHLSRFLIYVLINDISFSLSDLLPSYFTGSRFSLIGVFSNILRKSVPFSFQLFLHVFLLVCTGNNFIRNR